MHRHIAPHKCSRPIKGRMRPPFRPTPRILGVGPEFLVKVPLPSRRLAKLSVLDNYPMSGGSHGKATTGRKHARSRVDVAQSARCRPGCPFSHVRVVLYRQHRPGPTYTGSIWPVASPGWTALNQRTQRLVLSPFNPSDGVRGPALVSSLTTTHPV